MPGRSLPSNESSRRLTVMPPSAAHKLPITAAEYLDGETRSEIRHEFVDGRIYGMSGASLRHNAICLETAARLNEHLRGGPCRTFIESVKVQISDELGEAFYYPDVFVTCEAADDDSHVARHPILVIEVLSPSTSRNDRGDKLATYKRLPSIQEIVLIEQDWPELVIYRRLERWKRHIFTQPESIVRLESIAFEAPLAAFYQSAPFPTDVQRPWYLINREDG
ncbi:MAG: Uma2 family endonuclease [Verrucomicrobia bacterium]|nr:MAG: Uma2 family endonuclease [Verrucomicrobiota bacterium]